MELIFYLSHFAGAFDRCLQRSLRKAIPDFDLLYTEPEKVLATRTVVVGPAKAYFRTAFAGVVCTFFSAILIAILSWLEVLPDLSGPAFLVVVGALLVLWILVMSRVFHGGYLALDREGVHLRYRATTVFCPWDLFSIQAKPKRGGPDRVYVPVFREALDRVTVWRGNANVGVGIGVKTAQIRFHDGARAELADLYEVNCLRIANLLLKLGQRVGAKAV